MMKKGMRVRCIINPTAGRQTVQKNAEQILSVLLDDGTISKADLIRTGKAGDAYDAARHFNPWDIDLIMVVGGDGTVSEVVNGLIDGNHRTPLAILAAGTANDFAHAMMMPRNVEEYCEMVRRFKIQDVDAGRIGTKSFLNVAASGMLTDVSYKVPSDSKTVLGQMAYVLNGALDLPAQIYRTLPITIKAPERVIEDDILLFIVSNSCSVGGFRNLAPLASVNDGLLDVLVVHKQGLFELLPLMLQVVNGEHLGHPRVSYFQASRLEISCRDSCPMPLDIDGESGPVLPVVIEAVPAAIRLLTP